MTRIAVCFIIALLHGAPLAGQDGVLERALDHAVRAEFAERWKTDGASIVLEWAAAMPPRVREFHALRITGGNGGSWVVTLLDDADRTLAAFRVRIGTLIDQPVAARPIERGATITENDIGTATAPNWGPPVQAPAWPMGWRARRSIAAGERLATPAVAPPDAVRAGETVRITLDGPTVRLTTTATALGSATVGARVAVRLDNGRRIEGTVTGPGAVRFGTEPYP
jgi:flagella basal body P-ring formation protein FlgA